jgi:hypothetical protein
LIARNYVWWREQITKLLIIHFPFTPLSFPSQAQISSSASTHVLPAMWEKEFHTHTKQQVDMEDSSRCIKQSRTTGKGLSLNPGAWTRD